MDEIYIGLSIVVIVVLIMKTINIFHNYKMTIYPQIYSGFIEFLYRKVSDKRLSTSGWLEQNFGFHRLVYYADKTNQKRFHKFFVILIMSSGIYIINSKNIKGRVFLDKSKKYKLVTCFVNKQTKEYGNKTVDFPDPLLEIANFADKISKFTKIDDIHKIIQFLDDTDIEIENLKVPIICSHDFFTTIESIHKQKKPQFTELEIEQLYTRIYKRLS